MSGHKEAHKNAKQWVMLYIMWLLRLFAAEPSRIA